MKQDLQDLILSGEKSVALSKPIMRGTNEIKEVTVREPSTGELRGMEIYSILRMDVNAIRTLVPRISNITANEFDQLRLNDTTKICTEIADFFVE